MSVLTCIGIALTPGDYLKCFNEIPLINLWALVYVGILTLAVVKLYALFGQRLSVPLMITGLMGSLLGLGLFIAELLNPYYISISIGLMVFGIFLGVAKT